MIKITDNNYLSKEELALVRKYSKFVLDKFVAPSVQQKAIVSINIVKKVDLYDNEDIDDLKKWNAWCVREDAPNDKKKFTIILNASQINKRAKSKLKKLKLLLVDLGHELVHVKQYLNNETFDYVSGDVRYKGERFESTYINNVELYYDSPWEVDAYGREWGLYMMFCSKYKREVESK